MHFFRARNEGVRAYVRCRVGGGGKRGGGAETGLDETAFIPRWAWGGDKGSRLEDGWNWRKEREWKMDWFGKASRASGCAAAASRQKSANLD